LKLDRRAISLNGLILATSTAGASSIKSLKRLICKTRLSNVLLDKDCGAYKEPPFHLIPATGDCSKEPVGNLAHL
jgi:hypothetical protein